MRSEKTSQCANHQHKVPTSLNCMIYSTGLKSIFSTTGSKKAKNRGFIGVE